MALSADSQELLVLLKGEKKLTAMIAPSFPVVFQKKSLLGALKKLGFDKICDHTVAIATVNLMYESLFEKEKSGVVISANCPVTVNLIKTRFPKLTKFLPDIPSPMGMNGRLCRRFWPQNLNIFIGPCLAKKQEIKSYPEVELVLTYKELEEIFEEKGINLSDFSQGSFDFDGPEEEGVRMFPTSGGMKITLDINHLGCRKIIVGDKIENLVKIFSELEVNPQPGCLFYDVLACPGGCLGGPGVVSEKSIEERRTKLLVYITEEGEKPLCSQADLTG